MKVRAAFLMLVAMLAMATAASAQTVDKGTPVLLVFDEPLNSKTAKEGDTVKLHLRDDLRADGRIIVKRGTTIGARIDEINKRGRFGKNGRIKLKIDPLRYHGMEIPLQHRQKGALIGGKKGTQAAAASGAGALVLGPLGLAAGYFVVGTAVNVKAGDVLQTEVAEDVYLHR
jgi:hypothetical protein